MQKPPTMGMTEWVLLIVLSVLWGGSFFFLKILVDVLPPFTVVFGRVGIAAVAMNALLLLRRDPMPVSPRLWMSFIVMGLLNNVLPFCLFAWAEVRLTSGLAAILNATTPIFTVIVAHGLTRDERLSPAKGFGVLFGFAGVAVLIGPDVLRGFASADLPGEIGCLAAALLYAFAGIYGRRFRGIPALKVATGQVTASAFVMLPVAAVADRFWALPAPGAVAWGALAGIALLSTALAYLLYFRILAVAGATNVVLVTFLLPISTLILGSLFLGEPITIAACAGMALIACGLAAIDGRLLRAARLRLFARNAS